MKKNALAILTAFLIILPSAAWAERVSFLTDQYWYQLIRTENSLHPVLALRQSVYDFLPFGKEADVFAGRKKLKTRVIQVTGGAGDYESLSDAAGAAGGGAVLLSPLFSAAATNLAQDYPGLDFFTFSAGTRPDDSGTPANLHYIDADYDQAFSEAGRWAFNTERPVFSVFFTGDERLLAGKKAYEAGWREAAGGQAPQITEIRRTEGDPGVDDFVGRVDAAGECAAAVFAGPLTASILERFDGFGVSVAAEHLGLWRDAGFDAAASVELPPSAMLEAAVIYISAGNYDAPGIVKAEFIQYDILRKKKKI